jgi:methionyl-tRNA formyltransferase
MNGESTTGNSVIRLANKMDAGVILAQSELAIGETETAGELHDRLAADGAPLIARVLDGLYSGTSREQAQDHARATMAPKLSRQLATIDWSQNASAIARRINGLSPWPGCRVQLVDGRGEAVGRLTLLRARSVSGASGASGQVLESGAIAAGGSTAVEILEVQPEGKRPMALADYRRGHRWVVGLRVETLASGSP